eukprot:UC1_evm1s1745
MDSILEQQRLWHEEIERLLDASIDIYTVGGRTQANQVQAEHHVRRLADRIVGRSQQLLDIYADADGSRGREMAAIAGPDEMGAFYERLAAVREYHKRYPDEIAEPMQIEMLPSMLDMGGMEEHEKEGAAKPAAAATTATAAASTMNDADMSQLGRQRQQQRLQLVQFSGEEAYGRYLDMHECHTAYSNLRGIEAIPYTVYLTSWQAVEEVPYATRITRPWARYLRLLCAYLEDFLDRAQPLEDISVALAEADAAFEAEWKSGHSPGWPGAGTIGGSIQKSDANNNNAKFDLTHVSSPTELHAFGPDALKTALSALGLKCGGTLEQRAQRLFSTKGKRLEELDKRLFAKKRRRGGSGGGGGGGEIGSSTGTAAVEEGVTARGGRATGFKAIAALEARVRCYGSLLSAVQSESRENVERKQARTAAELAAEELADLNARAFSEGESGAEAEEEEGGDIPYNPKNLPLDWEGKPMPFWLYKLHGLNVPYKCEICGDYTYHGPKAFQQHFGEWRHAHGMRCLGIPNTKHFIGITQIDEARQLWETLKKQKSGHKFNTLQDQECEDSQGNVINKKTYEDLK